MASASPSENGSAPGGGGCAASPSAASIARAHSLSLASLPDEQHQARLGSKGGGDVGERGGRIGEEHRPEAADRHVEAGGVEAMHLGVAQLVPDVVEPFGRRHLTGALEHALGHVDADNAARRRGARRLASRQPGSAADVDYLVTGADPVGGAKVLVVSAQLGVVEVQAGRRGHRRDAMDRAARRRSRLRDRPTSSARYRIARAIAPAHYRNGRREAHAWTSATRSSASADDQRERECILGPRRPYGQMLAAACRGEHGLHHDDDSLPLRTPRRAPHALRRSARGRPHAGDGAGRRPVHPLDRRHGSRPRHGLDARRRHDGRASRARAGRRHTRRRSRADAARLDAVAPARQPRAAACARAGRRRAPRARRPACADGAREAPTRRNRTGRASCWAFTPARRARASVGG